MDFSAIDAEENAPHASGKNLLAAQEQAKDLCEQAADAEKKQLRAGKRYFQDYGVFADADPPGTTPKIDQSRA